MYKTKKNKKIGVLSKKALNKLPEVKVDSLEDADVLGFETLIYKIDKIEQSQGQVVSNQNQLSLKLDKVHDSLYDSNDGIFAKISELKLDVRQQTSAIENKLIEISEWKKHREKSEEKNDVVIDNNSKKLVVIEGTIGTLVKSKNSIWGFLKWFGVAVGGGFLALIFKWLEGKM